LTADSLGGTTRDVSSLLVIRHGQASIGSDDYDVLSPLGIEQARRLGGHLAARGERLDLLFCGPRKRQRDTAAHLRAAAAEAGTAYPEPELLEGLDELPAFELVGQAMPLLLERDAEARALSESTDKQSLGRLFDRLLLGWCLGELAPPGVETFPQFEARVTAAFAEIRRRSGRGKRVAVVTSAGPTSIALRLALGLSERKTCELMNLVLNSAMTELHFREDALSLSSFNAVPHLDRELITLR
jgi:broad specificity phosphatase PhoE